MAGGYDLYYYKEYGFIFIKVLQSFMRGSIDSIDQDLSVDRYTYTNSNSQVKTFFDVITNAEQPFYDLVDKIGVVGYIVYMIIFYLIANFIIKVAHTGYFLMNYRNYYENDLRDKRLDQKKMESIELKAK